MLDAVAGPSGARASTTTTAGTCERSPSAARSTISSSIPPSGTKCTTSFDTPASTTTVAVVVVVVVVVAVVVVVGFAVAGPGPRLHDTNNAAQEKSALKKYAAAASC